MSLSCGIVFELDPSGLARTLGSSKIGACKLGKDKTGADKIGGEGIGGDTAGTGGKWYTGANGSLGDIGAGVPRFWSIRRL